MKAILTPHAGYQFSRQIAALAYKQIASGKLDTVILLGPSHRVPFSTISVYRAEYLNLPRKKDDDFVESEIRKFKEQKQAKKQL
ncbi:TPA: AmmeMemoRadiSam system protein B [Candidatus Poribacteria bacterium]|nr:AmmeMemoRadiSam system protein B [Candidatus Poribacteria bacterium]